MKKDEQKERKILKISGPKKPHFVFFFKFFIVPLIVFLVALRIFVVKTYERELFYSNEAYVQRQEITVGSEGYGNVSNINVSVGDSINNSDTLYKYINTDLEDKIYNLQKKGTDLLNGTLIPNTPEANITINDFNKNVEFTVSSKTSGIIKQINISVGDYVTKDQPAMILESSEAYVATFIKVPADLINQIAPGVHAEIKLNNGLSLNGFVKDVSPTYDPDKNLLQADIQISPEELSRIDIKNIPSGTPVSVIVSAQDVFTEKFKDFVNRINIPILKSFFTYEI